jgi:hypothetical protein
MMTPEEAQDKLIAEWVATQPEHVQSKVAALPRVDGPSHEVGAADDAATWERAGAAEWADPSAWCDKVPDWLQEKFDLTPGQADGVAEWARSVVRREVEGSEGRMLTRVILRLLQNQISDLRVLLWALAYQTGVARRMTKLSPSGMARDLCVTRALMSHWMGEWESLLGFRDGTFAKSKEARENMRLARMRVVERSKGSRGGAEGAETAAGAGGPHETSGTIL